MARSRYRLSRRAVDDLQQVADYIRSRNPTSAKQVMKALNETFEFLALNPGVGTEREDLRPGLRLIVPSKPANSYIVFFYSIDNGIEVSDIIHAARDWTEMFATGER